MSKPKEPVQTGKHDLFRARLDQIIDMKHPLWLYFYLHLMCLAVLCSD